jgi:uncharacterized protein YkwD
MRAAALAAGITLILLGPANAHAQACADADTVVGADNVEVVAGAIVCLIGQWRAEYDAAPLGRSPELDRSSLRHSRDMVARRYLAHRRRGGPTVLDRIRAGGYFDDAIDGVYSENIGVVVRESGTARALVDAWLASPDHRLNIAHPAFRDIGVGIVFAPADPAFYPGYPSVVVTTDFGQRSLRRRQPGRCARVAKRRAKPYCRRDQR